MRGFTPKRSLNLRLSRRLVPAVTTALGFVAGWPLLFGLAGLVLAWVYQRYRAGRPELFVVHALYWRGFYPGRGRILPNALQRSYRP